MKEFMLSSLLAMFFSSIEANSLDASWESLEKSEEMARCPMFLIESLRNFDPSRSSQFFDCPAVLFFESTEHKIKKTSSECAKLEESGLLLLGLGVGEECTTRASLRREVKTIIHQLHSDPEAEDIATRAVTVIDNLESVKLNNFLLIFDLASGGIDRESLVDDDSQKYWDARMEDFARIAMSRYDEAHLGFGFRPRGNLRIPQVWVRILSSPSSLPVRVREWSGRTQTEGLLNLEIASEISVRDGERECSLKALEENDLVPEIGSLKGSSGRVCIFACVFSVDGSDRIQEFLEPSDSCLKAFTQ